MRRLGYQNVCLTIIAVLLGLGMLERQTGAELEPASASAQAQPQPGEPGGLTNALEQRKIIIAELRAMNARLDRIEGKMNSGGMEVKIKDMPPMKLPPELVKQLQASAGEVK